MLVIQSNGTKERFSPNKILDKINSLSKGLNKIDTDQLSKEVISNVIDGITTKELSELSAGLAANKVSLSYDYSILASRLIMDSLYKVTPNTFIDSIEDLYSSNYLSQDYYNKVLSYDLDKLEQALDYEKDFDYDFFAVGTLQSSYLMKNSKGKVAERPQHMHMRMAIFLTNTLEEAITLYKMLSNKLISPASPIIFNSGTKKSTLVSCNLISMLKGEDMLTNEYKASDSLEGIHNTYLQASKLSSGAAGIGLNITPIRSRRSALSTTNGKAAGIQKIIMKPINALMLAYDQSGKRKGAAACFVKGTEVYTNTGVKEIQNVELGDLVVTHKNRLRPVTQVHKNPLGDRKIYKLEVQRTKPIYVTGNHRFMSFHTNKYKNDKLSYGWNSIEQLKELLDNPTHKRSACYIETPTSTNIKNNKKQILDIADFSDDIKFLKGGKVRPFRGGNKINRYLELDNDFANLIGVWLGDGHVTKYGIGFTVHNKNKKLIDFILKTCLKVFGHKPTTNKCENVINIVAGSKLIANLFKGMFGSGFNSKRLHNSIFNWDKSLVNSLIAGLISTDGCITKKRSVLLATLGLSNERLITQLYHLCRVNGITTSFNKGKMTKGMTTDPYVMSIPLSKDIISQVYTYYSDNRIKESLSSYDKEKESDNFLKILSITEIDTDDEFVYTLGVEEDHSYTVEGLLAENCYIEPWHLDIEDFLEVRRLTADEETACRDIFLAIWMNDLFMERLDLRVKNGVRDKSTDWTLFCPNDLLNNGYGDFQEYYGKEFKTIYEKAEKDNRLNTKVVDVIDIWSKIVASQQESGLPYITYKDRVNESNMQSNMGVIRQSNLCVSGDSLLIIKDNDSIKDVKIKDVINTKVTIWNGFEWSEVTPICTGVNSILYSIELKLNNESTFRVLECTDYHKWILEGSIEKRTHQLNVGDKIKSYVNPRTLETIEAEIYNIEKVINEDPFNRVYCLTEPKRNSMVVNGVMTLNCNEIVQVTNEDTVANCVLSAIPIGNPLYIKNGEFDYNLLKESVYQTVKFLNILCDINKYPTKETKKGGEEQRAIAIGTMGLADLFAQLDLTYDSDEAEKLSTSISEHIYYYSLESSMLLAKEQGRTYPSFRSSDYAKGILHFDKYLGGNVKLNPNLNWTGLKENIIKYGLLNSLLCAKMPTASSANVQALNEADEPFTNLIYKRKVLSGEYAIANKHLIKDLEDIGFWCEDLKNEIILEESLKDIFLEKYSSSITSKVIEEKGFDYINDRIKLIKAKYRTAWELGAKPIIHLAASRQPFIDQTQSMNLWMADPNSSKLTSMHLHGWKKGLKTGIYYLRGKAANTANKNLGVTRSSKPKATSNGEIDCIGCSV